jgi:endonuclease-3|tara:strand:+ start:86849 stop:87538 length:690 start_codon:yes stop_codon:yes gene_type:complete
MAAASYIAAAQAIRPGGMKPQDVRTFFAALAAERPDPKTELDFVNDYTLLVAVVLSAQATDAGVNRATANLFAEVQDPAAMVALGEEGLKRHIRTIGLYNSKAKNVIALSEILLAEHDGLVPRTRAELQALPGVGRKTANVVLNEAFGEATLAVDTHVFRVANRTGLAPGKTVEAVETRLMQVVPQDYLLGAHHWLILHGRHLCKARKPECYRCPVVDICAFDAKNMES